MATKPRVTPPTLFVEPTFRDLLGVIKEDWIAHDRDHHKPGFRALAVHRFCSYRRTLRTSAIRRPLHPIAKALERRIQRRYGIELKSTAQVGRQVRIAHQSGIVIHPRAVIGDRCLIRQCVTIGSGVEYSQDIRPVIGCDVRIGAGAVIAGPCRIGDGARIGPNTVITSDVPENAMVVAPRNRVFASDGG